MRQKHEADALISKRQLSFLLKQQQLEALREHKLWQRLVISRSRLLPKSIRIGQRGHAPTLYKISSESVHTFLTNLAGRQQTEKTVKQKNS